MWRKMFSPLDTFLLQVTQTQESLLKDIVSALIPEGDLAGAGSLNVHDFVWVMVDDCMDKEKQTA